MPLLQTPVCQTLFMHSVWMDSFKSQQSIAAVYHNWPDSLCEENGKHTLPILVPGIACNIQNGHFR